MSWQAKKDFRECNSPEAGGPGNGFSRRAGMHRLMRFTVQKTFEVDGNLSRKRAFGRFDRLHLFF